MVSFVLPVRNEERHLLACLASLAAQQYPRDRFEILVVDGRSTDHTRELITHFTAEHTELSVRLLDNPQQTVAPGRNVGIRAARGDLIVFVEGHALLDPDFLREAVTCFAQSRALCLGRYVEQYLPDGTAFQRATGLARKSWLGHNPHSGRFLARAAHWMDPLGVATIYRREVFTRFGLFEESFTTNEDVEFNHRLAREGVQAWYSPRLRYRLQPRANVLGLFRQMFRYGAGKRRFTRRHPDAQKLTYLAPTLFCSSILGAGALLPLPLLSLWVAIPLLSFLGITLITACFQLRHGLSVVAWMPVVMFAMIVGFGFGYGVEAVRGLRLRPAPAVEISHEATR